LTFELGSEFLEKLQSQEIVIKNLENQVSSDKASIENMKETCKRDIEQVIKDKVIINSKCSNY
jgi:hypothetical protein